MVTMGLPQVPWKMAILGEVTLKEAKHALLHDTRALFLYSNASHMGKGTAYLYASSPEYSPWHLPTLATEFRPARGSRRSVDLVGAPGACYKKVPSSTSKESLLLRGGDGTDDGTLWEMNLDPKATRFRDEFTKDTNGKAVIPWSIMHADNPRDGSLLSHDLSTRHAQLSGVS